MHPVRRRSRRTAIPLAFIFIIFFFLPLHHGRGAFGLFSRRRSRCSLCSGGSGNGMESVHTRGVGKALPSLVAISKVA